MNIITKIEIGKKNKDRVNIFINEEFAFSVSAEIVYKENLKVKQDIDIDYFKKIVNEDNYIKCKNTALKIIERTHKSEKEIRDKLALKEYENHIIDKAINFLKEYNFLNDNNYAKMYVRDKSKTQGQMKIKYTLKQKGIDEELIEKELSMLDNDNIKEVALDLASKKYKTLCKRENDKYKLKQKLYRFLMGKGYEYNLISEVVKIVVNDELI